jgi:environmental stress-induced protein Ves
VTWNVKTKPRYPVRRYEGYRKMPWRNGRGFTLEIAREPEKGEDFAWRLSLADIDGDGEFSAYPGYRRALVLIAGPTLHLRFRRHGSRLLDPSRRGARFEGDWQTHCAVPNGRCTDLSLIVRRGAAVAPACVVRAPKILRLEERTRVVVARSLYGALFVLQGSVAVTDSLRARPRIVRAQDTLLVRAGAQRILRLRSLGQSSARVAFLCWRPGRPDPKAARR